MESKPASAVAVCAVLIAVSCSGPAAEIGSPATTRAPHPTTVAASTTQASSISEKTADATTAPTDPPQTFASQMSAEPGPIEWEWSPDSTPDPLRSPEFMAGEYCYGYSEPPQTTYTGTKLLDRTLTVLVGRYVPPVVSLKDDGGVTDLGNPFGEDAWLCTLASDGESVLAVGSDVWWSNDGMTWHIVEAFRDIGGDYFDDPSLGDSNLIWAAVGPLGYVVLGHSWSDGWFSPDLATWYPIDPEDGPDHTERGWFGPGNVTVSDKMIVIGAGHGGAWIGTPNN